LFILSSVSLKPEMIAARFDAQLSFSVAPGGGVRRGNGTILDFVPLTISFSPPFVMPDYMIIHICLQATAYYCNTV